MMRAVALVGFGGVDQLRDADWPIPEPKPGEIRIRIRAASFNPVDVYWRQGPLARTLPFILGRDLAGEVDALGEGVTGFTRGDAVLVYVTSRASNGTYAEYTCVPASIVARKPARLSWAEAAAIPVGGLTALHCVALHGQVQRGNRVFVAGGAGGVGSFALPLLQLVGAHVVTTAGSDASAAHLQRTQGLEAGQIFRYDKVPESRWPEEARALLGGEGAKVAIDLVGNAMKRLCFDVAAVNGRVVSVVEEPPDFALNLWDEDTSPMVLRALGYHFVQLGARANHGAPESWSAYARELNELVSKVEAGALALPPVAVVGPLSAETAREAHRQLESRHTRGKLVMEMP